MSFLYPLLLAGIAAVSLPIMLHMIRRHTSRRVPFSTLMFLRPTAPRLKNRRRLEHLPLLILRCLILCLLALAFARPFLARPVLKDQTPIGRRLAILVDTSASMRRSGMWDQALAEVRKTLNEVAPIDRVCLMTFDDDTRTLVGFEQWASIAPDRRVPIALQQVSEQSPGWARTALGQALVAAAEAIEDDEVNEENRTGAQRQIVLISDLQRGSNIEALQAYEWPEQAKLTVKSISSRGTTNATLQRMTDRNRSTSIDGNEPARIRVSNSPDATGERFQLRWADEGRPVDVYVPPGRSVVISAPAGTQAGTRQQLLLTGDDHDFDNTLYVAPSVRQPINIVYLGDDDPNNPKDMLFYVRRAFEVDGPLAAQVSHHTNGRSIGLENIETANLVIVTGVVRAQTVASLRPYVESGRTILLVMKSDEIATTLSGLTGVPDVEVPEANVDRYAMLARIEFDHPLLVPFADPRFADFTRIHFWKHRRVDLGRVPGARVLAEFDSGDPAWFEVPVGRGTLLVWTCGWHPTDSDLALSSKFAPLLYSILEYGGTPADHQGQYAVGDAIPVPIRTISGANERRVRKPDGSTVTLEPDQETFTETDLPGVYVAESATDTRQFAINVPAAESRTDPIPIEEIERLGVVIGPAVDPTRARSERAMAQSSFSEMESQQKLWRWVIIAALVMLLVEIWLGGWLTRIDPGPEGEQP